MLHLKVPFSHIREFLKLIPRSKRAFKCEESADSFSPILADALCLRFSWHESASIRTTVAFLKVLHHHSLFRKVGVGLWFSSTSQNLCRKSSLEATETWWEVTLQYERLDVLVFQARTQPNLGLKCNWGQVWEAIHLLHVELPQLWVRSFHLVKCWRYVETWRWNCRGEWWAMPDFLERFRQLQSLSQTFSTNLDCNTP